MASSCWAAVYCIIVFQLAAGSALSLGIALLIDPANAGRSLALALFVAAVAHPAIVGVRVFYRLAEEFVVHLRNKSELRPHRDGVVLYGAGHRCQLFLKERSYGKSSCYDGHTIAGLVDDERTLHFQWIYGYKVLGGLNDLPQLIMSRRIAVIVITASLRRETRVALEKIVAEYNVELSEWSFGNRLISGSHTDDLSRAGVTGTALLAHDE